MRLPTKGIRMTTTIDIDHELKQYIATAMWTTNADHLDPEGTGAAGRLEDHCEPEDIAPEALASMREDLENFIRGPECHEDASDEDIAAHERALDFWQAELGAGQIGHDFWLTRNGHGAGFWDRFTTGVAETFGHYLTVQAKAFGESYLYVGDDGQVYVS